MTFELDKTANSVYNVLKEKAKKCFNKSEKERNRHASVYQNERLLHVAVQIEEWDTRVFPSYFKINTGAVSFDFHVIAIWIVNAHVCNVFIDREASVLLYSMCVCGTRRDVNPGLKCTTNGTRCKSKAVGICAMQKLQQTEKEEAFQLHWLIRCLFAVE